MLPTGWHECDDRNAAALALKNMLGLACDPVCGLVEVPCVKRNVAGAVNAVSAAQLSLAGIKSAIPVDEVIDAMRRIGNEMSPNIKNGSGWTCNHPDRDSNRKEFIIVKKYLLFKVV